MKAVCVFHLSWWWVVSKQARTALTWLTTTGRTLLLNILWLHFIQFAFLTAGNAESRHRCWVEPWGCCPTAGWQPILPRDFEMRPSKAPYIGSPNDVWFVWENDECLYFWYQIWELACWPTLAPFFPKKLSVDGLRLAVADSELAGLGPRERPVRRFGTGWYLGMFLPYSEATDLGVYLPP